MITFDSFKSTLLFVFSDFLSVCLTLSGHVCTRERAENYMLSYNQAFICQERYTTSCGHLDWRRCTRYRVQTCYTPQQKYATKYRQVEECCPGWREDGAGACLLPVCPQLCHNGGSCVESGGVPGCVCPDGYSGDACQIAGDLWKGWYTVTIIICVIVAILITVSIVYICGKKVRNSKRVLPSGNGTQISSSAHRATDGNDNGIFFTSGDVRWAAPRNHSTVYPSAPSRQ